MILKQLTKIQNRLGYLPDEELRELAKKLDVPLYRINEVASFYPHFQKTPPRAVDVQVCRDMACHMAGSDCLRENLLAQAHELGESEFTVRGVSCLGQCDSAPALLVNDRVTRRADRIEPRDLLMDALYTRTPGHGHGPGADRSPLPWRIDPYEGQARYEALGQFIEGELSADNLLNELEASKLCGMGGAGFPTAVKWRSVRQFPATPKFIVCNADESEPGTFKDRELLRRAPYLLIEGMILAGLVVGAERGIIYIRHEYHDEIAALEDALREARERDVLGDRLLGTSKRFDIELFVSPGGYICGEETALLEALEDRRSEPRNKPPFPVQSGYLGKPTVLNNVETLSWVTAIALRGGRWYAEMGVNGGSGLRFVSVSGDVQRPGVYEVPFGITVRELIETHCGGMSHGQALQAVATSGPSGGFLPAVLQRERVTAGFAARFPAGTDTFDILDLTLDIPTFRALGAMLGAAFIVVGERSDLLGLAHNCARFYENETCGKCVPCRIGTRKITAFAYALHHNGLPRDRLPVIDELALAMGQTSICGLGQIAANPLTSILKYFPDKVEPRLTPEGSALPVDPAYAANRVPLQEDAQNNASRKSSAATSS